MRTDLKFMLCSVAASIILTGCGGDSSSSSDATAETTTDTTISTVATLKPQTGTQSYLFYGEVNHASLGSVKNVRVFDQSNPSVNIVNSDDTSDVRAPVVSTQLSYDASTQAYSDLHVKTLSYVSNGTAYVVPMVKEEAKTAAAVKNSSAGKLSDTSYEEINYLGFRQYLTGHDDDANKTVLITTDMRADDAAIDFGNREFLTLTYPTYGAKVDGYLVYNNDTKKVQKCNLDVSTCTDMDLGVDVGSRDFEGDMAGTTYSAFVIDDKLYALNKADGSSYNVAFDKAEIDRTYVQGSSLYVVGKDHNMYNVDMISKNVTKMTPEPVDELERIRTYTDDYVIGGSDTLLLAFAKDGSREPIVLARTNKTEGYKYVKVYGIANRFLLQLYSVNTDTKETRFKACILEDDNIECKDDSFWAAVALKKDGVLDFKSGVSYEAYAYVRVDDTDAFGGGTLKAVDPKKPMQDGLNMGKVPNYNFQTFLSHSDTKYLNTMIDSDGGLVVYAKNDTTYHVDAFYMNLLKENSVKRLSDTNPFPEVNTGREHCHGRHCMICHSFGGGKVYLDGDGSKSAIGYKVSLSFEDGSMLLADIAKGAGENFSIPLKDIKGNFTVNILDKNDTVLNHSEDFGHEGVEYANCNYCHARDGDTRLGAPGAISITPID
jgi:hypothetical protein